MPKNIISSETSQSRRDFLKNSAVVGGSVAAGLTVARGAHAAEDNTLKIGLIGCGGRGTGAAGNALNADPNVKLVAMADAFGDRLETSVKSLQKKYGDRIDVPEDRRFIGFDGYKKVLDSGIDVVLLTATPHFRPIHLKAAIDAGKHVFCEKPVAVDAPGIRSVLASAEKARKKNLNLVSGLCWRYHPGVKETMNRILDGEIGDVLSIQENYLTSTLWHRGRQPDDTEMAYQLRNWYYFPWLSGDFNVEQHVHSLDKALWANHDAAPIRAYGLGGRQVRTEQPMWGNIYDHMSVVYEFPGGVKVHSHCRQQAGCYRDTADYFTGTKGKATLIGGGSQSLFEPYGGESSRIRTKANMYDLEHEALFGAIRAGGVINNGTYMARSTMLGILGRMVCYTGQEISWEDAMNSQESLAPSGYSWDADPPVLPDENGNYPVPMPGLTKFV